MDVEPWWQMQGHADPDTNMKFASHGGRATWQPGGCASSAVKTAPALLSGVLPDRMGDRSSP